MSGKQPREREKMASEDKVLSFDVVPMANVSRTLKEGQFIVTVPAEYMNSEWLLVPGPARFRDAATDTTTEARHILDGDEFAERWMNALFGEEKKPEDD